jgi:glycogen(starch) synthase
VRVLCVGNMYPPHHLGGYELVWQSAVSHLRASGHEVRVLTSDTRFDVEAVDDPGVYRDLRWYWQDHDFPRRSLRQCIALERENAAIVDRHLDDLAPHIVSWWSMGGMSLTMIERVRQRGLPAVGFVHDDWLDYGPHVDGWLRRARRPGAGPLLARLAGVPTRVDFASAARYVFVSEATRSRAMAARGPLPDTGVAHSGIDPRFLKQRVAVREWTWRLLYVGRLDQRKGVDTVIEALVHLPSQAVLEVVGGGDEAEQRRLEARADALAVTSRVRLVGSRNPDQLAAAYAQSDVVIFPVRWEEPWGLVPLEAMAMGRPVVATGRGGSGEYLRDGENALLFDADDAAGLSAAITRLAGNGALRRRLREAGIALAEQHTAPIFNAAVEAELTRRLAPGPGRGR